MYTMSKELPGGIEVCGDDIVSISGAIPHKINKVL